jgi:hypothetical protein
VDSWDLQPVEHLPVVALRQIDHYLYSMEHGAFKPLKGLQNSEVNTNLPNKVVSRSGCNFNLLFSLYLQAPAKP